MLLFLSSKTKGKNTKTNSSPLWAAMTSGFRFYQRHGSWFHWSVPVFFRERCACRVTICCSVQTNRLFGLLAIIRPLNALKPHLYQLLCKTPLNLYHLIRQGDCCRLFLDHFKLNVCLFVFCIAEENCLIEIVMTNSQTENFWTKCSRIQIILIQICVAKCVEPDDQNMSLQD